jgi:hypothetical protein
MKMLVCQLRLALRMVSLALRNQPLPFSAQSSCSSSVFDRTGHRKGERAANPQ